MWNTEERKAYRIAKKLAKALYEIEAFDGDPEMIIEDARIILAGMQWPEALHAIDTLNALQRHYKGGENETR